ncbi:unnamed protein product [Moneuplotes crassus]|uniref:Uncharacterized protein n=1 Tax=Euplotes crassus TaxID=5936 RepID=A0AAD1X6A2_EUPCR|nr:unnamed protein product [Moneuplotes crassus]
MNNPIAYSKTSYLTQIKKEVNQEVPFQTTKKNKKPPKVIGKKKQCKKNCSDAQRSLISPRVIQIPCDKGFKARERSWNEGKSIEEEESTSSLIGLKEYKTTSALEVRKSGFRVQSPAYKNKLAQNKARNSMLSCFTNKANKLIKNIKQERMNSEFGNRTMRNSISSFKFKNFLSPKNTESPSSRNDGFEAFSNPFEMCSPKNFTRIKLNHPDTTKRRTRKERKTDLISNTKTSDPCVKKDMEKSLTKNIESITVYRGPVSKGYAINSSTRFSARNLLRKTNSTASLKSNIAKYYNEPKRIELSQNFSFGIPKNPASTTDHHSKTIFGKESLEASFDLPPQRVRNSHQSAVNSPFSSSTCSSVIRSKVLDRTTVTTSSTVPGGPYKKESQSKLALSNLVKGSGRGLKKEQKNLKMKSTSKMTIGAKSKSKRKQTALLVMVL